MRKTGLCTRRASALLVAVLLTAGSLAGCSGDDDASTGDGADAAASESSPDDTDAAAGSVGSGPVQLTVDGTEYRLQPDICGLGDTFSGPDGRVLVAVGDDGFPKLDVTYNPEAPETDGVTLTLSDAGYRTDASGLDFSVTPRGGVGTATLDGQSSSEEVSIEFSFECPSDSADDGSGDTSTDPDAASEDEAKTGFVEWGGDRTEYDAAEGDLDPLEGTGLCETEDVTGTQGDDYYRIAVDLEDGTDFFATSSGDFELGDTLDPVETSDVSVTKDGRTVSGSADTPQGELVFSFTC